METMKRIRDGSIDLILTDPPYNTTQCEWEYDIDLGLIWPEWLRILKYDGVIAVFADEPFTSRLITSRLNLFKYRITWDKKTGSNHLNAHKMPLRQTEDIVIFSMAKNGQYTYNPILVDKLQDNIRPIGKIKPKNKSTYGEHNGGFSDSYDNTKSHPTNLLSISSKMRECNPLNRFHPTQKPIDLMRWIIKTYSNYGDTVFDGYAGSGSVAIACELEGRNFIGSELNYDYYEKSVKIINGIKAQGKLF